MGGGGGQEKKHKNCAWQVIDLNKYSYIYIYMGKMPKL